MSARGLLVACGEESIRATVDAFERSHFQGLPVDRVLLPGGCWWLAQAAASTSNPLKRMISGRVAAFEAVATLLSEPGLSSTALLGHQDCKWYADHFKGDSPGQIVKRVGEDLFAARAEIETHAPPSAAVAGIIFLKANDTWAPRSLF